jgi:hypothetical protein
VDVARAGYAIADLDAGVSIGVAADEELYAEGDDRRRIEARFTKREVVLGEGRGAEQRESGAAEKRE